MSSPPNVVYDVNSDEYYETDDSEDTEEYDPSRYSAPQYDSTEEEDDGVHDGVDSEGFRNSKGTWRDGSSQSRMPLDPGSEPYDEGEVIDKVATSTANKKAQENPEYLGEIQKKAGDITNSAMLSTFTSLPDGYNPITHRNLQFSSGSKPNDPTDDVFSQFPISMDGTAMGGAQDIDCAFERINEDEVKPQEVVAKMADPVTGKVYNVLADLPPPAEEEQNDNDAAGRRLVQLQGGYSAVNPVKKTEVEGYTPVMNRNTGAQEFTPAIRKRERSMAKGDIYWNRDQDQGSGQMTRKPVNFVGYQDETPHTDRVFYVPPTQRQSLHEKHKVHTALPNRSLSGQDIEARTRSDKLQSTIKVRQEIANAPRSAPGGDATHVKATGVLPATTDNIAAMNRSIFQNVNQGASMMSQATAGRYTGGKEDKVNSAKMSMLAIPTGNIVTGGKNTIVGGTSDRMFEEKIWMQLPLTTDVLVSNKLVAPKIMDTISEERSINTSRYVTDQMQTTNELHTGDHDSHRQEHIRQGYQGGKEFEEEGMMRSSSATRYKQESTNTHRSTKMITETGGIAPGDTTRHGTQGIIHSSHSSGNRTLPTTSAMRSAVTMSRYNSETSNPISKADFLPVSSENRECIFDAVDTSKSALHKSVPVADSFSEIRGDLHSISTDRTGNESIRVSSTGRNINSFQNVSSQHPLEQGRVTEDKPTMMRSSLSTMVEAPSDRTTDVNRLRQDAQVASYQGNLHMSHQQPSQRSQVAASHKRQIDNSRVGIGEVHIKCTDDRDASVSTTDAHDEIHTGGGIVTGSMSILNPLGHAQTNWEHDAQRSSSGRFLVSRDALLPRELDPNQRRLPSYRNDRVIENTDSDRNMLHRDEVNLDMEAVMRINRPNISTNIPLTPRMVTPANSVPNTPMR